MSFFGKNIKKIRIAKKISQSAFADLFQLKRGSIGAYEEGRAEAKIDTIIDIANYFKLSLDQLLKKELTINDIYHLNELSQKLDHINKETKEGKAIPLVREKDRAAYLKATDDFSFLSGLKTLRIPDLEDNSVAFEYSGISMITSNSGMLPGDLFISKPLNISRINLLSENLLTIIITKDQLLFGRCRYFQERVVVKFDNTTFENIELEIAEIKKLWLVYIIITSNIPSGNGIELRLENLEKKLDDLVKENKNR